LEWDMENDVDFPLRQGYKFPLPLTYMEMCKKVNKIVQLAGSDPVRAQIRRSTTIEGSTVPCSVQFYCCHGRRHEKRVKSPKNPQAPRAIRTQESRTFLYSDCKCYFTVNIQPSDLHGLRESEDEENEEKSDEEAEKVNEGTEPVVQCEKKDDNKKYLWMVPEKQKRPGRPSRLCFKHTGHPKRTLMIGDIDDAMRADIRLASRTNMKMSSLQAVIYEKYDVFVSLSQLRYEIETMHDFGTLDGANIGKKRSSLNQAEALIGWILEQPDVNACVLIEDVDCSTPNEPAFETWLRMHDQPEFRKVHGDIGTFDGADAVKGREYDDSRFFKLGTRRVFLVAIV
jgi:hypothetical protein